MPQVSFGQTLEKNERWPGDAICGRFPGRFQKTGIPRNTSGANSDARADHQAVQNPTQQPHATLRNDSHDSRANPSPDASFATPGEDLQNSSKTQNGGHGIRTRNRFPGI